MWKKKKGTRREATQFLHSKAVCFVVIDCLLVRSGQTLGSRAVVGERGKKEMAADSQTVGEKQRVPKNEKEPRQEAQSRTQQQQSTGPEARLRHRIIITCAVQPHDWPFSFHKAGNGIFLEIYK